ncbi:hypothetical protein E1295_26745 [Nonomuraea mesophila]|uniref:Uncharacterized protein n=1 Tax=Nonomuraea mesophila TaxID=2530382 RepID=A0A4R5F5R1_9ACTN|nr:hypothetical protein [Nonomuraea mesophila]TDE43083.1 hypothetical protein E1295_26745 [Nonomuraea mesophila]
MISIIFPLVLVVVLVGGIIVTAMNRRAHGRGATLGMAGCAVLLVGVLMNVVLGFIASSLYDALGAGGAAMLISAVSMIFNVAGTSLLIAGVIARRDPQQPPSPHHPQPGQAQGWQQPQGQHQQPYPQQPYPQQPPQQGWQQPPYGGQN